jgi:integrase
LLEKNPAHGVRLPADGKRKLGGFPAKYAAIGHALALADARLEPWQAVEATRLIALSGLRRGEAIGLRWTEVIWPVGCCASKTRKRARVFGRSDRLRLISFAQLRSGALRVLSYSPVIGKLMRRSAVYPRRTIELWGMAISKPKIATSWRV